MPRPNLEPHLQRRLTEEKTVIGSLFQVDKGKDFFCSLYAPGTNPAQTILDHGSLYATGMGLTPEDAVYEARAKLWGGL